MKSRYKPKGNYKKKSIIRANEKLIILTLLFILGLLCGSYIFKTAQSATSEIINKIISEMIKSKSSQSILYNFFNYLLPDIAAITVCCMFGLSVFGEPVICVIPFIRGLGLGLTVAGIYKSFNTDGLLFAIILIMLPSALSIGSMLICCKENLITSKQIRKRLKSNQSDQAFSYKIFLLRNGILSTVVFVSSVLGSALCYLTASKISPLN